MKASRSSLCRLVATICLVAAGLSFAADKPKVVVMSVTTADSTLRSFAQSVTEQVMTELGEGKRLDVVGTSDLEAMLGLERQKQLLGCGETTCFAELSAAMGAPWLVLGTLGRAGKVMRLDLKLLHAADGQVTWRAGKVIKDESELFDVVTALDKQLLATLLEGQPKPEVVAKPEDKPAVEPLKPPELKPVVLEPIVTEPAAQPSRAGPWVLMGAGVVLAAAGGIVAGIAAAPTDPKYMWAGPITTNQVSDQQATGNALFAGGMAGIGLGVAAIAGGVAWAVTNLPKETSVTVVPAGNAVLVVGSF